MITIDNKAGGNCMYYAYAISLMYYLRTLKSDSTIAKILNRFNLSPTQHEQILLIIDRSTNLQKPFSSQDITTIQDILGPACRNLASKAVRDEFITKPSDTALYSASAYVFFEYFKRALSAKYRPYVDVVADPNGHYKHAEIFKVPGMQQSMKDYSKRVRTDLEQAFAMEWAAMSDAVPSAQHSEEKIKLMDRIIQQYTLRFFQVHQHKNLDRYVRHLNTDTTWGSEETLLSLNRALSGEKPALDPGTQQWSIHQETPINLGIAINGTIKGGQNVDDGAPHIILDNRHKTHWVSMIPDAYLPDRRIVLREEYRSRHQHTEPNTTQIFQETKRKSRHNEQFALITKEERIIETALARIMNDSDLKTEYRIKLLELVNRYSKIGNLDKASAKKGESDEDFAERLQAAEVRSLLHR